MILNSRPSLLADTVNGLLGPGSVARSTVSDWLHRDRLPRDPLPTVVAHLISDTLDPRWSHLPLPNPHLRLSAAASRLREL